MELTLKREPSTDTFTFGKLSIDGEYFCETLEDPVRVQKIPGKTAIPAGRYRIIISFSPRFKRLLPLLVNVPGFVGVRIHPGNTAEDTHGCLLVGMERSGRTILRSRFAFNVLYDKLAAEIKAGRKIYIDIQAAKADV